MNRPPKANSISNINEKIKYNLDKIFPPQTEQHQIFQEVKPFVKNALDGFDVCLLAYGQTGAGKTFTMEGPQFSE